MHACLRGFIKSKSIPSIQKHHYAGTSLKDMEDENEVRLGRSLKGKDVEMFLFSSLFQWLNYKLIWPLKLKKIHIKFNYANEYCLLSNKFDCTHQTFL